MTLAIGGVPASDIRVGDKRAVAVYVGTVKVWPSGSAPFDYTGWATFDASTVSSCTTVTDADGVKWHTFTANNTSQIYTATTATAGKVRVTIVEGKAGLPNVKKDVVVPAGGLMMAHTPGPIIPGVPPGWGLTDMSMVTTYAEATDPTVGGSITIAVPFK